MNETSMTTTLPSTTTTSNRPGTASLILAILAGVFLCLAGFSFVPAQIIGLSLPAVLASFGAIITGIVGLRRPARRWIAIVGLILGGLLLLGALCAILAVLAWLGSQ